MRRAKKCATQRGRPGRDDDLAAYSSRSFPACQRSPRQILAAAPDCFFTVQQQQRLQQLMPRWPAAYNSGTALSGDDQAEPDALVEAEVRAATERAAALLKRAGPVNPRYPLVAERAGHRCESPSLLRFFRCAPFWGARHGKRLTAATKLSNMTCRRACPKTMRNAVSARLF